MICSVCTENEQLYKVKPQCWTVPCRNAKYMQPEIELWLAFWIKLRAAESVPKEMILKVAECEDATAIDILTMLDGEYGAIQAEQRKQEQQSRR